MRNILLAVAVLGLSAASSVAAPTPNAGGKFVVDHKEERATLTQDQVNEVVKAKLGEVNDCWQLLPEDQRKKDAKAVLKLEIDEGGEVQQVDVVGLPEQAVTCISKVAIAWVFPQTDGSAETAKFDYPVKLAAE
jgi:hypothetical protein